MKKLLYAVGLFPVLSATYVQTIIWARQVWEKKDKTVQILFDTHACYFDASQTLWGRIDQKNLLLSNDTENTAKKQARDILWHASLYKENVHMWLEDMRTFAITQELEKLKNHGEEEKALTFLQGLFKKDIWCPIEDLTTLCRQAKIPCTNLEFRYETDVARIEKEVAAYDDGWRLNRYYKQLDTMTKKLDFDEEKRVNFYLFNARLVHHVAHCSTQHQIIPMGTLHGKALALALPLMGYTLKKDGTAVHPTLKRIMLAPENALEVIVQRELNTTLKANDVSDYAKVFSGNPADAAWAHAVSITHPINIRAIVEKERKKC